MANEQNLISLKDRTQRERNEIAKKGAIASNKTQKEKKTVQKILIDYLDGDIKNVKSLKEIAKHAGLTGDKSIKELVTAICILNTLKKGDVTELQKLITLLGEENENKGVIDKLDAVLNGIDEVMNDEQP